MRIEPHHAGKFGVHVGRRSHAIAPVEDIAERVSVFRVIDPFGHLQGNSGSSRVLPDDARSKLVEVGGRVVQHAVPEWVIGMDRHLSDNRAVRQKGDASLVFFVRERSRRAIIRVLAVDV